LKLEIGNWEEQYKSMKAKFLISTFRERLLKYSTQSSFAPKQISACPKSIFFNAGNSFSLFTDVKICEKAISF